MFNDQHIPSILSSLFLCTYIYFGCKSTCNRRSITCSLQSCHKVNGIDTDIFYFPSILLSSSHNSSPTRGREYKTSLQSAQDKEGHLKINIQFMKLVNIECTLYSRHYSKYYTYQKDSTVTPIYR